MAPMKLIMFLFSFVFLCIQARAGAPGDSLTYRRMACGLYMDPRGNILYKTFVPSSQKGKLATVYLDHVFNADPKAAEWVGVSMKFVVDTLSVEFLNSIFWRDKTHVYVWQPASDGGYVSVLHVPDPQRFVPLKGTWYATCGEVVYYRSQLVKGADAATLKAFGKETLMPYAYDKDHCYFNGKRMHAREVKALGLDSLRR